MLSSARSTQSHERTEQTAQAIADKAAELLAESGTPAIEDVIEDEHPKR